MGVAVNVTDDPAQVGLLPEVIAIDTDGVTRGLIVIVIPLLVAVAGLTHEALEVKTQVTICPLVNAVVV